MKKSEIKIYKIISVICCVVLSIVQTFLIYNTYKLEDENYFIAEKGILNDEYAQSIRNDKVFPGGSAIIDKYIYNNIVQLEEAHNNNTQAFAQLSKKVCDSIFNELRSKQNLDSVLDIIVKKHKLLYKIEYASTIDMLEVAFEANKYIPLYIDTYENENGKTVNMPQLIGGTLKNRTPQNMITGLTVSSPNNHSYRINFRLYIDTANRQWIIISRMLPTLLLSIGAIIAVVALFYLTFRNWLKQKKIADMQSDFVNNITHEFHTPLAAIIVANKNIQLDKVIEDKEKIKPLTEVIKRQSERLQHLIDQVIDITKINHQQLKLQESSLRDVLGNILLDYRLKLSDETIEIKLNTEAAADTVLLDDFWFTTMFTNLLDNAIKYNVNQPKIITITTKNEGQHLLLTVEDNGVGIKKEMLKNIYDKFFRDASALKHGNGLGLGLYYVKAAIDAHKWNIDVISEEGHGTRFIITI